MKTIELKVHFARDGESGLWFIAESDLPGLRVEAETVQELIRKVEDVAPHLIELNADEIMARYPGRRSEGRPAMNIRPVFDTPLAIAC